MGYPVERVYAEVAFLASHFHWPREQLLSLEHAERRRWVEEIARLGQRDRNPFW